MSADRKHRLGVALAALLSLAGLAVSAALLDHHVAIVVGGDPILSGACEVTPRASCDDVLASTWGAIKWGHEESQVSIPTALLGFAFFAAMSAWYVVVGRPTGSRRRLHVLPLTAAAVGLVACIVLAVIMYATLPTWCPLCALTHVITLALFVVTLLLRPRARSVEPPAPAEATVPGEATASAPLARAVRPVPSDHPSLRLVAVAVLLAAVTTAAAWSEYHRRLDRAYKAEFHARWQEFESSYQSILASFLAQRKYDIPLSADELIRGDPAAKHTVVVFTDYQCPWCAAAEGVLSRLRADYPGWFRVVFKYFPMNTTCNSHVSKTLHAASCAAAVTAEAARLIAGQEAFWKVHDDLFAHQKEFARRSRQYASDAAQRVGITSEDLWKRIQTTSAWNRIRADAELGSRLGVKATPTIFFDGRLMGSRFGDEQFWRYMHRLDQRGQLDLSATSQPASHPAASQPTSQPAAEPASQPDEN